MSLREHIIARIKSEGPMRLDEYMATCLLHPEWGYYTTRQPFGQSGDFVTAPEISQMFGELLGLCLAQSWLSQGAPDEFVLAELGPGRGTLMADVLRAARGVPGFNNAARIVLLEASPRLKSLQQKTLHQYRLNWVGQTDELPKLPLFFIANEFFDALPIRQFVRDQNNWRERQVGVANDSLTFGLGPSQQQPALADRLGETDDGDLVEYCPALAPMLAPLSQRIADKGGAGLIIDYGDWRTLGDTFQAVKNHERADPLVEPGAADLTAHVDFAAISQTLVTGCAHTRLASQGVFLERLGITKRAQALAKNLSGDALEQHVSAHRRLTHPDEMGLLFKVLGLYPTGAHSLPGLEP